MLLSELFSLFKLFLKLFHFLGQIGHLARIFPTLFPGLLSGIEGLSRLIYLLTLPIQPVTLNGVMPGKGSTISLASFAILDSAPFLGGWSLETTSIHVLSRHVPTSFGGCAGLSLIGSTFLVIFLSRDRFNVL